MEGFDQDTAPEPMERPSATATAPPPPSPNRPPVEPDLERERREDARARPQTMSAPVADEEISFEEAKADGDTDTLQDPPLEDDVVDVLLPRAEARVWEFGPEDVRREYVQRRLSFVGKIEWFSEVGKVLDKAMSGDNALTMKGLMDVPGQRGQLTMESFRDADTFVQAFGKLISYSKDFFVKSVAIWLAVPDYERNLFYELISLPKEEGGLGDDEAFEMIDTFIDQNYDSLADFFGDRLGKLRERISQKQSQFASRRSKPSRPTARPTGSR